MNDDATLPSELYEEYIKKQQQQQQRRRRRLSKDDDNNDDKNCDSVVDHEALLQNLLSVLFTIDRQSPPSQPPPQQQQELQQSTIGGAQQPFHEDNSTDLVDWIWKRSTQSSLPDDDDNNDDNDDSKKDIKHPSREYSYDHDFEWSVGLRYMQTYLLPHVISSPFELHSIASQSILMCDNDDDDQEEEEEEFKATATSSFSRHCTLCLLLCCMALQQCKADNSNVPLTKRWRRWQSITCETIYLFQTRGLQLITSSSSPSSSSSSAAATTTLLHDDEGDSATPSDRSGSELVVHLWTKFVVPSCLNVVRVLPLDANHVALFSGLVGTTLKIVDEIAVVVVDKLSSRRRSSSAATTTTATNTLEGLPIPHLLSLYEAIQSICDNRPIDGTSISYQIDYSEFTIWRDPWRRCESAATSVRVVDIARGNDDVDFGIHRNDLSWWIHRDVTNSTAETHIERVADMDTTWNSTGISLLSSIGFYERAMVYHSTYIWMIWFPHVRILLKSSLSTSLYLEDWLLTFIQRLIEVTPNHSLSIAIRKLNNSDIKSHHHHNDAPPDSPLEVFQLLSNRMMVARPTAMISTRDDDDAVAATKVDMEGNQRMAQFRTRSERFVGVMKGLLSRYNTICQIHIVGQLIKDCPNPGLQARFLDILRPILFDSDCQDEFGILLRSILGDYLWAFLDRSLQQIVRVDELIQKVEVSIGAITMIRLWYMVRGAGGSSHAFEGLDSVIMIEFLRTLRRHLDSWSNSNAAIVGNMTIQAAPEAWHRLFLLDSTLQSLLDVMKM
jgi:hypothetical protein